MRRSTLLLGVAVTLAVVSTRWVRVNVSSSLPVGFYWLSAVPVEIPRGALVVVPVPGSVRHVWPFWVPLLKPVAGVPGDVVCAEEGRLQVNGSDYGPVYVDRQLPHLDAGCHRVPEAMVFLASPAPKSLDGRYFGMTSVVMLTAGATPLLTWR